MVQNYPWQVFKKEINSREKTEKKKKLAQKLTSRGIIILLGGTSAYIKDFSKIWRIWRLTINKISQILSKFIILTLSLSSFFNINSIHSPLIHIPKRFSSINFNTKNTANNSYIFIFLFLYLFFHRIPKGCLSTTRFYLQKYEITIDKNITTTDTNLYISWSTVTTSKSINRTNQTNTHKKKIWKSVVRHLKPSAGSTAKVENWGSWLDQLELLLHLQQLHRSKTESLRLGQACSITTDNWFEQKNKTHTHTKTETHTFTNNQRIELWHLEGRSSDVAETLSFTVEEVRRSCAAAHLRRYTVRRKELRQWSAIEAALKRKTKRL